MPLDTIEDVEQDADFRALTPREKRIAIAEWTRSRAGFADLDPHDQQAAINTLQSRYQENAPEAMERAEGPPATGVRSPQTPVPFHAQNLPPVFGKYAAPYRFGGESAQGRDCSSYTQCVYRDAGIRLPRTANDQLYSNVGERITTIDRLQPGDQVFFNTNRMSDRSQAGHTGIYLGNGQFVHQGAKAKAGQPEISDLRGYLASGSARFLAGKRYGTLDLPAAPVSSGAPPVPAPPKPDAVDTYRQKWFASPDTENAAPKVLLDSVIRAAARLKVSPDEALRQNPALMGQFAVFSPVGQKALLREAGAVLGGPRQGVPQAIASAAAEAGMTPAAFQQAVRQRGLPAVVREGQAAQNVGRRFLEKLQARNDMGASLGTVANDLNRAVNAYILKPLMGQGIGSLDTEPPELYPNVTQALEGQKGFSAAVGRNLAQLATPGGVAQLLAMVKGGHALTPEMHAAIGADWVKSTLTDAKREADAGDGWGALGTVLVNFGPVAAGFMAGKIGQSAALKAVRLQTQADIANARGVAGPENLQPAITRGFGRAQRPLEVTPRALPPGPGNAFEVDAQGNVRPVYRPDLQQNVFSQTPREGEPSAAEPRPPATPSPAPSTPSGAQAPAGRITLDTDPFGQTLKTQAAIHKAAEDYNRLFPGANAAVEKQGKKTVLRIDEGFEGKARQYERPPATIPPRAPQRPVQPQPAPLRELRGALNTAGTQRIIAETANGTQVQVSSNPLGRIVGQEVVTEDGGTMPLSSIVRLHGDKGTLWEKEPGAQAPQTPAETARPPAETKIAAPTEQGTAPVEAKMPPESQAALRQFQAITKSVMGRALTNEEQRTALGDILERPITSRKDVTPEEWKRVNAAALHLPIIQGLKAQREHRMAGPSGASEQRGAQPPSEPTATPQGSSPTPETPSAPPSAPTSSASGRRPIPKVGQASETHFARAEAELSPAGQLKFLAEHKAQNAALNTLRTKLNKAWAWVVDNPKSNQEAVQKRQAQNYIERTIGTRPETRDQARQLVSDYVDQQYRALDEHLSGEIERLKGEGQAAPPQEVQTVRVSDLHSDPVRFQYKKTVGAKGVSGELTGQVWNPDLAGVLSTWTDPATGKRYVVNGHNRFELAKERGVQALNVREINVPTAQEARQVGALQNIAEGRGTPIDAATLFRESGITARDLAEGGVSLKGKMAADGLALARLPEMLWRRVFMHEMPISRGVAIGSAELSQAQQLALHQLIMKMGKKGTRLTDPEIAELSRFVSGAGETTSQSASLFGEEAITQSNAIQKAKLAAWLKDELARDKRIFKPLANEARAQAAEAAGNVLKVSENRKIAEQAEQIGELFKRFAYRNGPIAGALNDAAARWAGGSSEQGVKSYLKERVATAIQDLIGGRETPSPERVQETATAAEAGPTLKERIESELEANRAAMQDALKDQGGLFSGVPPELLGRAVYQGALYLAKGAVTFAEWSARMLADFGEAIRPHLQRLYTQSQAMHKERTDLQSLLDNPAIGPQAKQAATERLRSMEPPMERATLPPSGMTPPPAGTPAPRRKTPPSARGTARQGAAAPAPAAPPSRPSVLERALDTLNATKSLTSSADLSAPGRQGAPLIVRSLMSGDFRAPAQAFVKQVQAGLHQEAYARIRAELDADPWKEMFTDAGGYSAMDAGGRMGQGEEAFLSRLASRLPFVRGSERAYVTFLDWMRVQRFKAVGEGLTQAGVTPQNSPEVYRDLAGFINRASGRGSLGVLDKPALAKEVGTINAALNAVLYSARFKTSRLALMNPAYYARLSPGARAEAVQTMAGWLAATAAVVGIARSQGAQVQTDPRSADFLQIQIGRARYDPWAGFRPFWTLAARLYSGETKETEGKKAVRPQEGAETVGRFLRGSLSPVAGAAVTVGGYLQERAHPRTRREGGYRVPQTPALRDFSGQKMSPAEVGGSLVTPMFLRDVWQAVQGGEPAPLAETLPGFFGVGVTVHTPRSAARTGHPVFRQP